MKMNELTVETLKIVDSSGKVKILLEGGTEIRGAAILMYSNGHPALQILENLHDNRVVLSFYDKSYRSTSLSENGICVDDAMGRPAIVIGCGVFSDIYQLTILKDGVPIFQLPLEAFDDADDEDGDNQSQ